MPNNMNHNQCGWMVSCPEDPVLNAYVMLRKKHPSAIVIYNIDSIGQHTHSIKIQQLTLRIHSIVIKP